MATDKNAYAAKVSEAEAAVQSVKDAELRRVAFEKVLAHLLHGDAQASEKEGRKTDADKPRKVVGKKVATAKGKSRGPAARLVALVEEGWFKKPRTIGEVKAELATRGYHIPRTSLSGPLQRLTRQQVLRRQKVSAKGSGKPTYAYSNWG